MSINMKKLTNYTIDIFAIMCEWYNDEKIKPLITPRFSEKMIMDAEPESLMEAIKKNTDKITYIVRDEDKAIGVCSIIYKFGGLIDKGEKTAWISIIIGDGTYRGKGIGRIVMKLIEEECVNLGFKFIELGVFDFNEKAKRLYEYSGYKEIGRNEKVIYYDGEWFDDIHMLKKI